MSFRDVLFGIAVADGIGNPLEFLCSVSDTDFYQSSSAPVFRVSDDTQMTLFCAEALWTARDRTHRLDALLKRGYLNWLITQRYKTQHSSSGLLTYECMYRVEAPGRTCISALSSIASGDPVVNDSKGNGTVMRCAPIAYWALEFNLPINLMYKVAAADARITHKHRYAADSSMFLTGLHYHMGCGMGLSGAVMQVLEELDAVLDDHLVELFSKALRPEWLSKAKEALGGWVAEEALALAIGAVACTPTYEDAIREAITIKGDSDTVGGIAGGLAAAAGRVVPSVWAARVNVASAMEYVLSLT